MEKLLKFLEDQLKYYEKKQEDNDNCEITKNRRDYIELIHFLQFLIKKIQKEYFNNKKLYILKNIDNDEKHYYLDKYEAEEACEDLNNQYAKENSNSIHDTQWEIIEEYLN